MNNRDEKGGDEEWDVRAVAGRRGDHPPASIFGIRVYIEGIRRPNQASFSLMNSVAYVECRHCLAYCWGSFTQSFRSLS